MKVSRSAETAKRLHIGEKGLHAHRLMNQPKAAQAPTMLTESVLASQGFMLADRSVAG